MCVCVCVCSWNKIQRYVKRDNRENWIYIFHDKDNLLGIKFYFNIFSKWIFISEVILIDKHVNLNFCLSISYSSLCMYVRTYACMCVCVCVSVWASVCFLASEVIR